VDGYEYSQLSETVSMTFAARIFCINWSTKRGEDLQRTNQIKGSNIQHKLKKNKLISLMMVIKKISMINEKHTKGTTSRKKMKSKSK
jgi:hypothetical protein